MRRQVLLLATAQALFQTASTLLMTVAALAGRQIAPTPALATAPIASMFLGTVLTTVPGSLWMARAGRRIGFIAGALFGTLGGLVAAFGVYSGSLIVLSLGTLLVGSYHGFAQYYRFAAAEVADASFRPRAISLVLAGGIVAAIAGPELGKLGMPLIQPAYTGSFLILAASALLAALLLTALEVPPPATSINEGPSRPLLTIVRQPSYAVALFAAATGGGVMVLAMTATPLAMLNHAHGLPQATTVIQAHVLGMFLPSFFTGSLIARFGVFRIMLTGAIILAGYVAVTLSGTGVLSFGAALFLLGIGWNFLFLGGTTLLTTSYRPAERGRAQAANELTIFSVGLVASLSSGALLEQVGWRAMNLALLPWLAVAVVAIGWLARRSLVPKP